MNIIGLIGNSLRHSFSRKYFNDLFIKNKLSNHIYANFEIEDISLITNMLKNNPSLLGFNATIPYKQQIIPYLNKLDDSANKTGSVNCVKITKDKSGNILTGYNTDIFGFEKSLLPLLKDHHTSALILGTGGSSLSVEYVLKKLRIDYTFISRTKSESNKTYEELDFVTIRSNKLIINTTPVGMFPNITSSPNINYSALTSHHLLYDLIYNPDETEFLRRGKEAGATIKNGLEMLHLQADRSYEIFLKSET